MSRRDTYQDVKQIVENVGYELLSSEDEIVNKDGYVWSATKIKVRCDKEHEYNVVWNSFKNLKRRCRICYEENRKCTYEDLLKIVKNRGYELLSNKEDIVGDDGFIKATTYINVKCNKGHEYNVILNNFKNNNTKCKQCYDEETRYTYEDLKNIVEDMGYELVSEEKDIIDKDGFIPTTARISVKKECSVLFNSLINGGGYNESKGEKKIAEVLDEMNIPYFKQYRFDKCRYKNPLPFDFYLPQHNICIEYDGALHYEPIGHFGGDEHLENTQLRDEIKTKYCKKHKIKLIRIPYWDFDRIEDILQKEIRNK